MKYLKLYESYTTPFERDEVDDILEVFRDFKEDYNLERKVGLDSLKLNEYKISFKYMSFTSRVVVKVIIDVCKNDIKDDVKSLLERYKNMGFKTIFNLPFIGFRDDKYARLEINKNKV